MARREPRATKTCTLESLEQRTLLTTALPNAAAISMAYDAGGTLHVAFYDSAAQNLKYATRDVNGTWSAVTTVDAQPQTGSQLSVAVDAYGHTGIAYYDAVNGDLKFAANASGTWVVATVDSKGTTGQHPSLVYQRDGTPVITYFCPSTRQVRAATPARKGGWAIKNLASKATVFSSAAVNPATGMPLIAFETNNGQLKVSQGKKTGAFPTASLVAKSITPSEISVGFGADGLPAISYYDAYSASVKIIRTLGKKHYGTYVVSQVAAGYDPSANLLFDPSGGSADIVYYDATDDSIYLATGGGAVGSPFTTHRIKIAGNEGFQTTIAMGSGGAIAFTSPDTSGGGGSLIVNDTATTPLPPTGVTATAISSTRIDLSWTDNSSNETGFLIERSANGQSFSTVTQTGPDVTSYSDTGVLTGRTYFYRVSAIGSDGSTSPGLVDPGNRAGSSTTTSATTPLVPGTIAGYVYLDANNDGQDNNHAEPGFATTVALTGTDDLSQPVNLTTTSDAATGAYSFTNLRPGTYTITIARPAGYVGGHEHDSGTIGNLTIASGASSADNNFGQVQAAAISGVVYRDTNNNGTFDAGDSGLAVSLGLFGTDDLGHAVSLSTTSSAAGAYSFGSLRPGTYSVSITTPAGYVGGSEHTSGSITGITVAPGGSATGNNFGLVISASSPQYLLTPALLSSLRTAAANNAPQWVAFKSYLDAGLNQVDEGSYQGFELPPTADYALGYRVLENLDPATASEYADKAIAILTLGLDGSHDATGTGAQELLARGDGATKTFALPNTGIHSATLKVWTNGIQVKTLTKGATNGQDSVDFYYHFLKVSKSPDGPADYAQGTDWRYNPNYGRDQIDWSLPGNEPATGATYYVTEATAYGAALAAAGSWTFNPANNTITFTTAPAANQAIFVEYQYDDPTSGLRYQQTNDGRGGFNNIQVDSGYTARNLQYIAIGLDWLWDYAGLSPTLRSRTMAQLIQWSDYLNNNSGVYMDNTPTSNYGAGYYALRTASALAVQNRAAAADAARLMQQVQSYHDNYVLPMFQAPTQGLGTNQGGFWSEGWNYGPLAVENILTSDLAYEAAGWGSAAPDRAWASDAITALLTEQPIAGTVYDGGDGYAYPLPFPSSTLLGDLAYAATDPALKSYATYAMTHGAGVSTSRWQDLLFQDPAAPAAFWGNNLPLAYLSPGTGLAVARRDWNYNPNSTWLSFHAGNLTAAAHQATDQGQLEIDRGGDPLLVNYAAVTGDQTFQNKSTYGNAVVIDDGGAGQQTYRYAQGVWYGDPGVSMTHFDNAAAYTYMQGDYAAAYTKAFGSPGSPDPASELVRDVFYVRGATAGSDYVITYDRATTTQPQFLKQLRWHFLNAPTITGPNAWVAAAGASKLFGQTYSDAPLVTAITSPAPSLYGTAVQELTTTNTAAASSVRYVTAMQVTASATAAMDASAHVESSDGRLEGTQIGSYVVLFGNNGTLTGTTASTYAITAAAGSTTTHYVTDLTPGTTYNISGANQPSAVADAQGVLTFTSTGTGAVQNVTLTPS